MSGAGYFFQGFKERVVSPGKGNQGAFPAVVAALFAGGNKINDFFLIDFSIIKKPLFAILV
jgi:hypothetical protein